MDNDIGRALKRETENVRLSKETAARIAQRAKRACRARKFRGAAKSALAMAAAALILVGAVSIARKNARRVSVNTPLAAASAAAEPENADMKLVYAEGKVYHTYQDCAKAENPVPCTLKSATQKGLTQCELCKSMASENTALPKSTPEAENSLIYPETGTETYESENAAPGYTPVPQAEQEMSAESGEAENAAAYESEAYDEDSQILPQPEQQF